MRTGRLLHLVYIGRRPTVTRKEGSYQIAFSAEAKYEQHERDRAQELCQRFQERFRAHCSSEFPVEEPSIVQESENMPGIWESRVSSSQKQKHLLDFLDGKFSQSPSNNTSQRTERRICALPSLCIYPSLHHLRSGILQQPRLAPHPAMLA